MNQEKLLEDARRRSDGEPFMVQLSKLGSSSPRGLKLYGPRDVGEGRTGYGIEPKSPFDGSLLVAELKAILVVYHEARTLKEMIGKSDRGIAEVGELFGLAWGDAPTEVVGGMVEFTHNLSHVAAVRERLSGGEKRPVGTTNEDKVICYWWDRFADPIQQDDFCLGVAVADKLVEIIGEMTSRFVVSDDDVRRRNNRVLGIRLAAAMYLHFLAGD